MKNQFDVKYQEIKNKAIQLYKEGKSCKEISNLLGIHRCTVGKWMKEVGIIRSRGTKTLFNEHYFDKIDSSKKAYYLGWLMADGYLKDTVLKIHISLKDRELIDSFLKDLQSKNTPLEKVTISKDGKKYYSYYISLTSKYMEKILNSYGIVFPKLNRKYFSGIDKKYFRDFFRGLFDGDGHIDNNITCCGTKELLELIPFKGNIKYINGTHVIYFNTSTSKEVLKYLYYDESVICLKRKYYTAMNILKK
jgi:DNA-binding transcriptional regulator WhiA